MDEYDSFFNILARVDMSPNERGIFISFGEIENVELEKYDYTYYNLIGQVYSYDGFKCYFFQQLKLDVDHYNKNKQFYQKGKLIPVVCNEKISKSDKPYKTIEVDYESINNIENYQKIKEFLLLGNAKIKSHNCNLIDDFFDNSEIFDIDNDDFGEYDHCLGVVPSDFDENHFQIIDEVTLNLNISIIDTKEDEKGKKKFYLDNRSWSILYIYAHASRYDRHYDNMGLENRMCSDCYLILEYGGSSYPVQLDWDWILFYPPQNMAVLNDMRISPPDGSKIFHLAGQKSKIKIEIPNSYHLKEL